MEKLVIIDAHSHLWLQQNTTWNGLEIRSLKNGRSIFLGEEVQMIPPFIIDGRNTAEVFLSNMDYAQVSAAVVVQEFIDGLQNDYLFTVMERYPNRFLTCGMADYLQDGFLEQASSLIEKGFKGIAIPGHRLLSKSLTSDEMMRMFRLMESKDVLLSITLADGDRQVGELREVIAECPRLRIAIGHMGMANPPQTPCWENSSWQEQIKLARNEHVYVEMGGITWLYNSEFYPFPSAVRAIREADSYVLLSDDDLDDIVYNTPEESDQADTEVEQEQQAPLLAAAAVDTRPMIRAYNSNLDVTVTLRRTAIDADYATWENEDHNLWYTPAGYTLGSSVWNTFPNSDTPAWGEVITINQ